MRKKYTLSRIGAVALLANFAICGANAQVRATQQSAPSISNTIMRVASEDGRKLWGNVLFDKSWASISEDYYAYGWYEFMAKDPVKVKQLYVEDFFRATGSGAWIGNNLYFIMYQNFWGVDMIYYYKLLLSAKTPKSIKNLPEVL